MVPSVGILGGLLGVSGNIGVTIGNLLRGVGYQVHGLANKSREYLPWEKVILFDAGSVEFLTFLQSVLTILISCPSVTPDTAGFFSRDLLENLTVRNCTVYRLYLSMLVEGVSVLL